MAELEFLAANPNEYRDSTISVLLPDGPIVRVADISYLFITSKCPLLSYTFESSLDGGYQACIEVTSEAAMVRLLRYIYTDSYLTSDEESTLNISLLTHVETYKIARDYDLPALQLAANSSLTRAVEISCSVPNPPSGLCDAIRFVYKYLATEQCLLDTLRNYCVSAFRYHRFGTDPEFQRVAYDIPKFHQDICITNHERDFQDEGASDIVSMSASRPHDRSIALFDMDARTHAEFHFDDTFDPQLRDVVDESHSPKRRKTYTGGTFYVIHQSKNAEILEVFSESEQSDEDDGFTLVHRPTVSAKPSNTCQSRGQTSNTDCNDSLYGSDDDFPPRTAVAATNIPIRAKTTPPPSPTSSMAAKTHTTHTVATSAIDSSDDEWTSVPSPSNLGLNTK